MSALTRPPRFIIGSAAIIDGLARVTGSELHHLRDVRRLGPGAALELLDEAGTAYIGHVERFEPDAAVVTLDGSLTPSRAATRIILASAIIKGPRMDFLVEKAVELGASELWPCLRPTALSVN